MNTGVELADLTKLLGYSDNKGFPACVTSKSGVEY